jgi:hypothetical protein
VFVLTKKLAFLAFDVIRHIRFIPVKPFFYRDEKDKDG